MDSYSPVLDSNEFLSLSCQWSLDSRFDFDSLPVELLGFRIAPNKKFPAFRNMDSLWLKEKKKVSSYLR